MYSPGMCVSVCAFVRVCWLLEAVFVCVYVCLRVCVGVCVCVYKTCKTGIHTELNTLLFFYRETGDI